MQGKPTILFAEDDDGHALLVKSALKKAGFVNPVIRFCDGQETLDFLFGPDGPMQNQTTPMVLLLDIRMPKVDGIQVLRRIRERDEFNGLPVIMVTTMDDPGEMMRCHQLGCNLYLVKPVDWKVFNAALTGLARFLSPQPPPPPAN
jgi:DNA-binding response OmpR family regulator